MLLRRVTLFVSNIFKRSPRSAWKVESCQFHASNATRQKKKKTGKRFSKGDTDSNGPKIIRPGNCADLPKPILDPQCKNAIITGGANGFGFVAADHLLCKGARSVIILDCDPDEGRAAARTLCDYYGKDRVQFLQCDIQNICQYEATLNQAVRKQTEVHILFNDLDKERYPTKCQTLEKSENYTTRAIRTGLKILGKNNGGPGGIIVNCASIFGFMGWPDDPFPVYCKKEPVIEVTMDFADEYKVEVTGVRLVALCPANKSFCNIGLPDFPDPIPNNRNSEMPACIPISPFSIVPTIDGHPVFVHRKRQVGPALNYVLAWAKNGSTWLVEPEISVREIPRLIHFPQKEGEKIDPKIYETQPCTVKLDPPCVDTSKACVPAPTKSCEKKVPKKTR